MAAGTTSDPSGAIAVRFNSGKAISISTLGSDVSVATAMSGTSRIAGDNIFDSNPNSEFQAFLYTKSSMKNINSASLFPSGTAAWGVNNSGQVVGTGYLNSSSFLQRRKMVDIGPPGSYQASAVAINNSGRILGGYYFTSGKSGKFLYSKGKITTLPVPSGSSAVSALAINDNDEIAGAIYPSSGAPAHAATFNNGVWRDLGVISGAVASTAICIDTVRDVLVMPHRLPGSFQDPRDCRTRRRFASTQDDRKCRTLERSLRRRLLKILLPTKRTVHFCSLSQPAVCNIEQRELSKFDYFCGWWR